MWSKKEWKVSCRPRRARNTSRVAVSQMRSVVPALLQTVTRPVPVPSRRLPPSPRASQTLLSCCGQRHWEASRHPAITATVSGSQVLATWVVVGSNPLHLVGYLDHPTINAWPQPRRTSTPSIQFLISFLSFLLTLFLHFPCTSHTTTTRLPTS